MAFLYHLVGLEDQSQKYPAGQGSCVQALHHMVQAQQLALALGFGAWHCWARWGGAGTTAWALNPRGMSQDEPMGTLCCEAELPEQAIGEVHSSSSPRQHSACCFPLCQAGGEAPIISLGRTKETMESLRLVLGCHGADPQACALWLSAPSEHTLPCLLLLSTGAPHPPPSSSPLPAHSMLTVRDRKSVV